MTTAQLNRFAGPCSFCGSRVQAGAGTYSRTEGVRHSPGQCKTTTKTYRDSIARQRMTEMHEAVEDAYAGHGYSRLVSHRVEHADTITGHGLRALVGGYDRDSVMASGVRVYRDGQLIHEVPVPRYETSDFYGDMIMQARAIVAILDSLC